MVDFNELAKNVAMAGGGLAAATLPSTAPSPPPSASGPSPPASTAGQPSAPSRPTTAACARMP